MVPADVDGMYTVEGGRLSSMFERPTGRNFYVQPDPVRPEHFESTRVPVSGMSDRRAIVDTVPELVYEYTWKHPRR